jgi:putative spermidine/putrescine transport system substrate-binding protein
LVLANLILDPEFQAAQVLPENGFGLGFGIDVTRVSDPDQVSVLEDALANLGEAATPAEDMAKSLVGDAASPYQALVEDGWREHVLIGQ